MLTQGINLPPSQFEAMFVSLAYTEEDIEKTIQANSYSLKVIKESKIGRCNQPLMFPELNKAK